jgi:SRSO17 transposase
LPILHCNRDTSDANKSKGIGRIVGQPTNPFVGLAFEFTRFIGSYQDNFITTTRSVFGAAQQYLCGLIQADKKNMGRMEEAVPDSDEQVLQHFLTDSPWSYRDVMDQVALDTDSIFGGDRDTCLIIDESGILKKGDKSVGVARQWCGQYGKVDNCQVGVFASLSCRNDATLIDARLYLPKIWTSDFDRCREAGVSEEHIVQKSKVDLALEMTANARINGIGYNWVGADAGYGKDPGFLRSLALQDVFLADVHKDQRIYLEDPEPIIPEPRSPKGRKPSRLVAQSEAIRVDKWAELQPESAWELIAIREGTRGKIWVEILHRRVWLWNGEEETGHCWHLIVRREPDAQDEIKYSLSNASESVSTERLAFMQGQRYWVERSFQDGKNDVGFGDYQARKWNSWHHHMALVMMAMLFILKMRLKNREDYPLLSFSDVKVILAYFLPKRVTSFEEVLRQMEVRHAKRLSSTESASRKKERYISDRGG